MPRSDRILDGQVVELLQGWGHELGFSQIGVAGIDLREAETGLLAWLAAGFHGSMAYMERHGLARARPAELAPGTVSVITACMDYLPRDAPADWAARESARLLEPGQAVVSVYARGRDYHKVLRARLRSLAERLAAHVGPLGFRVFTDSAPVLEAELAVRSGLGWRGKHTLVLHRDGGSMRFLGEIYVDALLPPTTAASAHCGECTRCLEVCPTQAILAPYKLDARRCISYLTIEENGAIPPELRPAIGNRIYGCDDCQLACPWNKYARRSGLADFDVRQGLDRASLLELWQWDEAQFLARTEGSAIRRAGWQRWRRNLAVALGNALRETGDARIAAALAAAQPEAAPLVAEHIDWALEQPRGGSAGPVGATTPARVEPVPRPGSDP
jgi:epoxyqueuosine reductase